MTLTTAPSPKTRRRSAIRVALVILAVIAAAVVWLSTRDHSDPPQVLGPRVGGFSFVADPVPVSSSTMQFGIMAPYVGKEDSETLTFRSATAHFRRNSANATATISVCRPRGSSNGGLGGGGAVQESTLKKYCQKAHPVVSGTKLRWGTTSSRGEFLVLTVSPTRPGVADVDSFTLDYSRDQAHGGQSGVEILSGQKFVVKAE